MTATERAIGLARLNRGFMIPDIYQGDVWEVQANHGETHYVPGDCVSMGALAIADADGQLEPADIDLGLILADYIDGTIDRDEDGKAIAVRRTGVWLARLSAPGYLDCTDWSVFDTEDEAIDYLIDTYDEGPALDE